MDIREKSSSITSIIHSMDMNTPDTEITKAVPLPHEPAVTTNVVTSGGGGKNTPDTEWREDLAKLLADMWELLPDIKYKQVSKAGVIKYAEKEFIAIISSRDTYWKERMRKEVEGMRIAKGNYNCGEEGCCNPNPKDEREKEDFEWQIGYNTALDTLLDNLK